MCLAGRAFGKNPRTTVQQDSLYTLIQETKNKARDISLSFISEEGDRGKVTMVLSISDTIALFTSGEASTAIQTQAEICSWLIPHALEMELPLRGAISYGTYSVKENIMLGYAVDEAASWHETTDWIGVVLAPSAQMRYSGTISAPFAKYAAIPFKKPEKNLMICVDWTYPDKESLYRIIEGKGPLVPDIAAKYLNTIAFLDRNALCDCAKLQEKSIKSLLERFVKP